MNAQHIVKNGLLVVGFAVAAQTVASQPAVVPVEATQAPVVAQEVKEKEEVVTKEKASAATEKSVVVKVSSSKKEEKEKTPAHEEAKKVEVKEEAPAQK
ncbi:MAG TPA: hypothetical protein VLG71_01315 [Candidatus Limnocylindria bacterium]|nr:hypothetical protein [Candidatus Limnocylindria bacterium]